MCHTIDNHESNAVVEKQFISKALNSLVSTSAAFRINLAWTMSLLHKKKSQVIAVDIIDYIVVAALAMLLWADLDKKEVNIHR